MRYDRIILNDTTKERIIYMKEFKRRGLLQISTLLLTLMLLISGLTGCAELGLDAQDAIDIAGAFLDAAVESESGRTETQTQTVSPENEGTVIDEEGSYTSKEDVALYIHIYGKLPGNFITKDKARELGWEGGGLEDFAPGCCIGGDRFGNYEGLLPKKEGRSYTECDIDTLGADTRGAKRIVFSNDGVIYYTDDHYESFTLLYGKE